MPRTFTPIGQLLLALLAATSAPASAQQPPDSIVADSVLLLEGLTVPIGRLRVGALPRASTPFAVQSLSGSRLGAGDLADALSTLPGVTLGSQTGSAAQSDLRVRGFTVSPVVGVPQSVSVFVDGVRVNEADASQVHLSLVPSAAIERVELLRGPVGAFGKNALAGAVNIVTARGAGSPFVEVEAHRGSYGSWRQTARGGGAVGSVDGFFAASRVREDGWRELEATEELSLFGKVGWLGERTDAWLSYTSESDSLEGPGPLPESWIRGGELPDDIVVPPSDRRRLQYTGGSGDAFRSRMHFLNSSVSRAVSDTWTLQATSFLRRVDFRQSNDNITEPDAQGITDIRSYGSTAQLSHEPHERLLLVLGAEVVHNRVDIEIRERPNRAFPDLVPATTELLRTNEDNFAGFAEAWWAVGPRLGLHASLRFDHTYLPVVDLLDPADSGENTFREFSGGVGMSADFGAGVGGFVGFARGFRAPVILEVSCADPEDPCQLPFELGPDPPLEPVVSDTWQAGIRFTRVRARAEVIGFWAEVHDDIFNIVDLETPTRGYFTNLERTRRVGTELIVEARPIGGAPGLSLSGTLGLTRATFQSSATLSAPFLSDDDDAEPEGQGGPVFRQTMPGEEELEPPAVEPGDRFPMVPAVSVGARVSYDLRDTGVELGLSRVGSQRLVGDESNDAPFADLDAYTLIDFGLEHRVTDAATAFVAVSNLLDASYARFGIISGNVRDTEARVERFLTPGRPREIRVGMRVRVQ